MVRLRNWFLHFFIVFLTSIVAIHLVWTYSPIKKNLKVTIITELRPYLGEAFLLNDFSVGFGYISFYGVTTTNEKQTYKLNLQEVRLSYNMLKLLWYEFDPLKVVETVTLKNPRLILYQKSDHKTISVKADSAAHNQVLNKIFANFQKIPNIDRIQVSDAEIVWELIDGNWLPVLDRLNGYLVNTSTNEIDFDLVGKFHGAASSVISLIGDIELAKENLRAWLIMDDCQISDDFPFLKNGIYSFDKATLDGAVYIFSRSFSLDSVAFNGNIKVKDFSAHILNQHAIAENFEMSFSDQTLEFKKFGGTVEDGEFTFNGIIEDLSDPQIHWYLDVRDFSAKHMKNSHEIFENVLDGKMDAHAEFSGLLRKIQITANATSPAIQYAIVPFTNVEAELTYSDHLLEFSHVRADFKKFSTTGTGYVNLVNDRIAFQLKSDLQIPPETFEVVDKLNKARFALNTDFSGDVHTKQFYGNFNYSFKNQDEMLFKGSGPYTLDNQFLYFTVQSPALTDTLLIAGAVDQLFSNPTFKTLSVRNSPIQECTSSPVIAEIANDYRINLLFNGPYNNLEGKMSVLSELQNDATIFTLAGNLKEVFTDTQNFRGQFTAQTSPIKLSGEMEISFEEDGLRAEINSPDLVNGNLFLGYTEDAPLEGKLFVNKFSVSDYLPEESEISKIVQQGFLEGEITVSGTAQKPDLHFDLAANEFILNDVGYYSTRLNGEMIDKILSFDNFQVRLNSNPVFTANFLWNLNKDSLQAKIDGENIESNFLAETILKDKDIIRGSFSYAIQAKGSAKRPAISGNIEIRDGTLMDNSFKVIHVAFEDSISANAEVLDLDEHIIKIKDLVYINQNEFTLTASGLAGLGSDGLLDLKANVSGNVLGELPRILSYFKNAESVGELSMRVEGSRSKPQLTQAKLSVFDGSMEFESVIPPIKELQIEVELSEPGNFVHIEKIEGKINNQPVKIYNVREAVADSINLSSWYLEDLDLDFGILVMQTEERGIPLSIPGLMEEGDIGYFAVDGRSASEKFYFAGPVDEPHVRGKIVLSDSRVTFPFIESGEVSDESNPVVEFLMGMDWDVQAVSREGNRYFVEIPAYVGETYMDLNIDNVSQGLTFTGKLDDESFRVEGSVQSSRGRVDYLDFDFKVEKFGAEFSRFELYPTVYGRAYTTVRDSTGDFSRDIYLVLYAIDPETNQEISRGRWEDFRFKLVSSDPVIGETQQQVLAYLGYSVQNIPGKASEVGLAMTENFLVRPIMRPLEKSIERGLGLDYVRFRSRLTSNLFYMSMQNQLHFLREPLYITSGLNNNINPALLLLQSSEFTVGKYLAKDLYLTYTGQLLSGYEETNFEQTKLGLYHRFGLEYRLLRNLLLEIEYNKFQLNTYLYDRNALNDFRIKLRHSFHF